MQVVQAGFKEFLHLFNSGESSLNEQKTYDRTESQLACQPVSLM